MHPRLVSWTRAVKARRRGKLPVAWLFTDPARMPDLVAVVSRLPPGTGVVFRHDGVPGRLALAHRVARVCRARRLVMVMTEPVIAGVGVHMRRGRLQGTATRLRTSSAHTRAELVRAKRAGAAAVFLSPLFITASHPDGRVLGGLAWRIAARGLGEVWALGGVAATNIRAVPRAAAGFGAIGCFVPCCAPATVFRNCHAPDAVAVAERAVARQ